jgi:membrane-bound serine protease (ClpP class)
MDSIMGEKTTNDAAAFIRSIAEKRGRNMEWAEDAVRYSVSLAETEAVKKNVVNYIANDEAELLEMIHGTAVAMEKGEVVLNTRAASITNISMSWVQQLLNYISDPNVAYILMLLGIYGLIFEFYNPGVGFPGVLGGISLILAFYAMHTLPINVAGLALIALAIVLFILELSTPTNGILSIGAVVSLLLGSMMLIKPGVSFEWAKISLGVIIPAVIFSAIFFLTIVGIGIKAQRNKVTTGAEGLQGDIGKALTELAPTGNVMVQGEIWAAESTAGTVAKGTKVRVIAVDGLKVFVEPISS